MLWDIGVMGYWCYLKLDIGVIRNWILVLSDIGYWCNPIWDIGVIRNWILVLWEIGVILNSGEKVES